MAMLSQVESNMKSIDCSFHYCVKVKAGTAIELSSLFDNSDDLNKGEGGQLHYLLSI